MSHVYHDHNSQTLWYDECPECEHRAARLPASLGDLDSLNRIKAWHYMRAWRWPGGSWDAPEPSVCDRKLFDCLYTIAVFLERAGINPLEFETRMVKEYDLAVELAGRPELRLGATLDGIDLTGIFVRGDL